MAHDLSTHPRVAALLEGPALWHRVEHHAEVGSTNDVALERARAGVPPGLVVIADRQLAGRGRVGREWRDRVSERGAGSLLCSALVPDPEANGALLPLAVGLALSDAVRRQGGRPRLKWPNDVLLGGHKCAGILVERHAVEGGAVTVVGMGVNVDWRGVTREDDETTWTSIAEMTGDEVDRGDLLADLLRGLASWLHSLPTDPVRLLIAYRDACESIGRPVRVTFPDGEVLEGRAVDLEREGRLVVDTGQQQVAVNAGDIEHLRPAGGASWSRDPSDERRGPNSGVGE